MKTKISFIIVLALLAGVALGLYFRFHKQPDNFIIDQPAGIQKPQPITPTSTDPGIPDPNAPEKPARVINDQYQLFRQTGLDQLNNFLPATKYKDDGDVQTGKYAGYHRLAGFISANDPSNGYTFIFATKDYKTFILDKNSIPVYIEQSIHTKYSPFNEERIVAIEEFPSNFPETIEQGNFVLVRGSIDLGFIPTDEQALPSPSSILRFFAKKLDIQMPASGEGYPKGYQEFYKTEQQYLTSTTQTFAEDPAGLVFEYQLVTKEAFEREKNSKEAYKNYQTYYLNSELTNGSGLYKSYGQLYPWGCGNLGQSYLLKNITVADLTKLTTTLNGQDVFVLTDKNHPIYKAGYFAKVSAFTDYFTDMNKVPVPNYETYVAKNPVLIIKDAWGRWLGLGEIEYLIPGGCGKPVVYLYPEKPTEVSIEFLTPIKFTVDIPNYSGKWKVLASPDGSLKDLQSKDAICSSIDASKTGSGYAAEACKKGIYPYLYWAGQVAGDYPAVDKGFIVAKENLPEFLNNKLTEVGLNEKEKQDMLEYWVPFLQKKNAPYFRLAFLQTQELNKLIPMRVSPAPDTTFRLFLDWTPLMEMPKVQPATQVLAKLFRKGFTLVEWGGLKQ